MARKLTLISELAGQTTHDITRDVDGWKRYLTTAARLYKYRFDEQLLIFAQRPDATACAEMELWNEKMRRWVKPGSKGIALIRQDGYGKPHLEYVFDVADTRPVRGAKMPYLWEMREEHQAPVLAALEAQYGETEGADMGERLMELTARAVREVYREHLRDLAYDTEGSLLEELDELNLEVRYRDTLTASVQYALLSRCGLDPSSYLDDTDLQGITEFSTPAVLHHLGDAASTLSMGLLQEIGRTIKSYDRENLQSRQKNVQKPLAKAKDIGYTKGKEEFNTLKRESEERGIENGGTDIHEERRLPDSRLGDGRRGRDGGHATGQVRDAAADLPSGEAPWDVHLHAADGEAHAAPAGDRPAGAGTGRPDAGRDEETGGRDGGTESPRSDGMGAGGEQPDGDGRGSSADRNRLQVNETEQEAEETAGEEPAVFASEETAYRQITLFPTVEEQIENIAQAQAEAEEQQAKGRAPVPSSAPVAEVPEAVIGRALTSGSNNSHSIERMVAFFQKPPTGSAAASFMEKEYGTGGKGLFIGGKEYALWFDHEGIRIAQGKTTNVPGCTLVPWVKAGALAYRQLKEGMFASQEKIDAARDNEYRELSEDLWYLRQDLSEEAEKQGFLPRLSELYGGFPESTEKIAELLKTTEGRADFGAELSVFAAAYENDRELLRFRLNHNPQALLRRISDLDIAPEPFKAKIDGFAPSKGHFITQDEIDHMLTRGSGVSEGNLRIYAYFMQGHDAKERAAFLRNEYGDGGFCYTGYDEWHDSKGIKLARADDFSGREDYDTVRLNWNQTQKRIGELIEAGRYLNPAELAYMPEYEKMQLARSIHTFYYCNPNDADRTYPHGWDFDAAKRDIRPLLDDPDKSAALYADMVKVFAVLTPDELNYSTMQKALDDMAAYQRGEYSLFTPLPEGTLQAERQKKQAAKKAKSAPKKEMEPAPVNELEAAARALARKSRVKTRERNNGQLTFDFAAMRVAEPEEPAAPPENETTVEETISPDLERERQQKDAARREAAQTLEQRGLVVSDELLDVAMTELDREAVDAAAIVRQVEETLRRDEEEAILSQYDLGYGHMGNGLTVWNRQEEEHGDYKTIAHIAPDRTVTFYDNDLPELIREQIQEIAATSEVSISAIQDAPVFSTPARTEPVQPEKSPVALYREALGTLVDVVRQSSFYDYLRDRDTEYDEAKDELDNELNYYLEEIAESQPDLHNAFVSLPLFREWMVEDILEHTYQDYITDNRDAIAQHAADPDAPEWAREAEAARALEQTAPDNSEMESAAQEGGISPQEAEAPEVTGAGASEAQKSENAGAPEPPEPSLTPNVEEYLNLKAQHPDKLIGVQVGGYYLFYGKDAEEAAPALGAKLLTRDIPGLGETCVTGGKEAWQAQLGKLLEHGHSVVLAQPDPERPEGPYEIVKERDIADFIPIGMELTIDGRRMKIDSVNYETGRVSLMDMALRGIYPIFRDEPVAFVREYVEEAQQKELEDAARLSEMVNTATAAYEQSQREMEQAGAPDSGELEEAKGLIEEFLYNEFGNEEIDFPDLEHIGLAYTTTEDEQHEIQAEVNLVDYSVSQFVDDVCVQKRDYRSLRELIDAELAGLDFDDLVRLEETPPETVREEEPPAELVEIDGGTVGRAVSGPSTDTTEIDGVKLHSIVIDLTGRTEPEPKAERRNFHITDDNLGTGGQKTKYQNNVAAIRTLREIEAESRLATPEEQETLSKYVGWGGLAQAFDPDNEKWTKEHAELKELLTPEEYRSAQSTVLNAHYTSPAVIKAIYEAVGRMDFTPGNVLEPSCGIGNFFGLVPEKLADARLYGVELDSITGRIAKQLYQKADITVDGFETTDHPDDFFDLAVGNVPFGEYKVHDKKYDKQNLLIHDYFLSKTLDKVRPGGLVAFITTKGTMDKQNAKVRESLAQKADLLGAVRLPNTAFKANAGTEVTCDILFFQKRGSAPEKLPEWVQIGETEDGVPLNNYFLQHPEMVLGKMAHWQNMYGNATETACLPVEGADLSEQLSEAVRHIAPPDPELLHLDAPEQDEDGPEGEPIPADPNVRNFSFALSDGKIYFRENSRMKPVALGKTPTERVKGMVGIRDCARKLIDLQMGGAGDEEIKAEQARLNTLYDRFHTKYGLLNDLGNSLAFRQDSSYPLLCSLEVLDDDGNLKRKADMFTKRTIARHQAVTSVDTAAEALAVSIGERACVDLGYMASLMGGGDKIPQIVKDLKSVIFKDPASGTFDIEEGGTNWYQGWQTADEYLSGDVRKKLAAARAAAEQNPEFAVNAEALEQVQPKDLTAAEISVRIGAPWIKPEYYRQFMFELMQTPYHLQHRKMDVLYSDVTGEWNVKGKGEDSDTNARVWNTYGTKRINAYGIFEDSLNQRNVQVFDTVYEDGREKRVLNGKETAIAQQKQELMAEAFRDWIFKDPERRADLCKTYNTIFNSTRPREFNGEHIRFVGMNPEIALRPHQCNAVARMIYGGNTLLAHCVGAGKTYTMTAAAMEAKRLGLSQKSLFVVPNHLTEQWGGDFLTLYPGAKVLVATKKDFKPRNRKKFCARIATGDYDAVVIGHSQFEKIPISPARQEAVIQEQIDEIVEAIKEAKRNNEEKFTIKQMEKTKKNLDAKIKKLYDKKRDDTVTFEELGIDRLFVDEAHFYKNLYMHTKMRNVGGISQTEAQKSSDMFAKCRYLDEITGGHGVTFATGTPISNSMVELYTMMRYLQYSMLEEHGLKHFDSWAADFGEKVTAVELKPEGTGFRTKTRFARFYNLPELINMWKEAADIQTADMLNLPTPEAEYITVQTEPSEAQKQMVQSLAERAEVVRRGRLDPRIDNMLKITSDGRKLALDQRIMNPLLADDPDSKVNACVGNVFQVWQDSADIKGTQLVFCDLSTPKGKADKTKASGAKEDADDGEDLDGVEDEEADRLESSVYEDIRKKLIARGVPANEIAFIHDAKTDTQKAELFAKVRKGQVRVLLGSTAKMGAGTNVQDRIVATHDLDCPWRPADLEQRLGRSIRQGNMNEKVKVFRYVTKGTFDAYNWGLVESKQRFIGQVYTSKTPARSIEDVDATALSYAEVKMLATGDERIKEKMDLDIQVSKLKMLKANHNSQKFDMEDKVRGYYPQKIQETQLFIDCLTAELPILQSHPAKDDAFSMTVLGKVYTERKEAGEAIIKACQSMKDPEKPIDLGEYRGFPMRLCFDGAKFKVTMKQHLTHTAELSGDSVVGNIARINNALEKIPESLQNHKNRLAILHKELESAKEEAARPFPQEDELTVKSARLNELNAALDHVETNSEQQEQDGAEEPAREDSAGPELEGGKPSILKTLREYERPAPVPVGAQRGDRREVL